MTTQSGQTKLNRDSTLVAMQWLHKAKELTVQLISVQFILVDVYALLASYSVVSLRTRGDPSGHYFLKQLSPNPTESAIKINFS